MVIGGLGATLHGAELATGDLDVVHALSEDNLRRIANALQSLEADSLDFPGLTTDDWPALLGGSDVWRWHTRLGDLDMMSSPSGAPRFETLKGRAAEVDIRGVRVRVAALEDLIAMKQTTGRHKDIAKLVELQELARLRAESEARQAP